MDRAPHFDFAIIGSGFGGSVSALRLTEKGYRVVVLEKGRRWSSQDFAHSNWNLPRWLWQPGLGCRGPFRMTFFRHLTVLSGVGVGGGSLVYANTLPRPKPAFFEASSWAHLADWREELEPHYASAERMLGATPNPKLFVADQALREIACELGREEHFLPTRVGVFFGEPEKTVPDPYFGGAGPERAGCKLCGGCMVGCRHRAKNTLDRNYLYLAEQRGCQVLADTEVRAVRPRPEGGYRVEASTRRGWLRHRGRVLTADQVIFSGGVLGTVDLLLRMRADPAGLPQLSPRLGDHVRTNSESLTGVVSTRPGVDHSEGIAITSIVNTDEHSHLEPVRYPAGSGFFRLLVLPYAVGGSAVVRLWRAFLLLFTQPLRWLRAFLVRDFARATTILLYMRTLEETIGLRLRRSLFRGFRRVLRSHLGQAGHAPSAFMPEATELGRRMAEKLGGVHVGLLTETALGNPTTAHILGGCCMGRTPEEGVIDPDHRVFGYRGLYVIDGSAVSANPGVNPSLTITALAERAMSKIPDRAAGGS